MKSNKDVYRAFSENNEMIPIYSKGWWLDAVCGRDYWDVNYIEQNGKIIASMPYFTFSESPFLIIKMPPLTQNLGIHIVYPEDQKLATKYSYERKIIEELISKIPKFDWFQQSFHHSFKNWLPFYWNNFKQTTAYTYILDTHGDLDSLYNNLKSGIRWDIRKAEKSVIINESDDVELLYNLNTLSYKKHNIEIRYDLQLLKNIYNACQERDCCKLFVASEENSGKVHSAHLYVWDSKTLYYLVGGSDLELKNSGAASLLMWHGIKMAHNQNLKFDFEGSMNQSIERFFSSFGAEQTPYMKLEKINSKLIKIKRAIFN